MAELRSAAGPYRGHSLSVLPPEDDELTHVGPQTPCGEYMRRFWLPVAMSSQLGDLPVAVRILGEDLVVFRDRGGRVGLLHRHCAHRRASLEYGRIEERGIRCCYHGWHFDIDGTILETPGEPAGSPIRHKVFQGAYPTVELKGLVFAYLGEPERMPEFPYFDSMFIEDHDLVPYSIHSPSNWLQESENSMDPYHSVFLHGRVSGPQFPGLEHFVNLPVVVYHEIPTGFVYSHARRLDDLVWIRFHDHITPSFAQNGGMFQSPDRPKLFGRPSLSKWVVPIDDTNTRKFGWRHFNDKDEALRKGRRDEVGWEAVDFYGQTGHRSYEEMQRNPGDWEAWVGQGPINVHARENLGTTDKGRRPAAAQAPPGHPGVAGGRRHRAAGRHRGRSGAHLRRRHHSPHPEAHRRRGRLPARDPAPGGEDLLRRRRVLGGRARGVHSAGAGAVVRRLRAPSPPARDVGTLRRAFARSSARRPPGACTARCAYRRRAWR